MRKYIRAKQSIKIIQRTTNICTKNTKRVLVPALSIFMVIAFISACAPAGKTQLPVALPSVTVEATAIPAAPTQPPATPTLPAPTGTSLPPGTKIVVIDTDMAGDDWMAILYLLQRPDIIVQAITVTGTGEAHCQAGVKNALGLVALAGNNPIPVACGRETPLQGDHVFPDSWRSSVDSLFWFKFTCRFKSERFHERSGSFDLHNPIFATKSDNVDPGTSNHNCRGFTENPLNFGEY